MSGTNSYFEQLATIELSFNINEKRDSYGRWVGDLSAAQIRKVKNLSKGKLPKGEAHEKLDEIKELFKGKKKKSFKEQFLDAVNIVNLYHKNKQTSGRI